MIWDLTFYNNISCGWFSTSCQDFANLCCFSLIDTEVSLSMDSTDFQWKLTQVICTMFCGYTHLQVSNALSAQQHQEVIICLNPSLRQFCFFMCNWVFKTAGSPFRLHFAKWRIPGKIQHQRHFIFVFPEWSSSAMEELQFTPGQAPECCWGQSLPIGGLDPLSNISPKMMGITISTWHMSTCVCTSCVRSNLVM